MRAPRCEFLEEYVRCEDTIDAHLRREPLFTTARQHAFESFVPSDPNRSIFEIIVKRCSLYATKNRAPRKIILRPRSELSIRYTAFQTIECSIILMSTGTAMRFFCTRANRAQTGHNARRRSTLAVGRAIHRARAYSA